MPGIWKRAVSLCGGLVAGLLASTGAVAAPEFQAHDYAIKDFHFRSGETLPELKLHYYTLGEPKRDAGGHILNAVLILHGTGGSGRQFAAPQFADVLFAPGGLLDPAKYFLIMPDDIGHGGSSKPSNGLKMHFPHYDYADMVEAEHAVVAKALGVQQLRLVMGTSMGCMHSFMYAEMYPDEAQAAMPLACQSVALGGRNRLWRKMAVDAIEADPAWQGGDYAVQPALGLRGAENLLLAGRRFALADADRHAQGRAGRRLVQGRVAQAARQPRRQRPDLPTGGLADLQSVARSGEDQGAADLDQFRRRFHQPARTRSCPARGQAGSSRAASS